MKRLNKIIYIASIVLIPMSVFAQEWSPQLVDAISGSYRGPTEPYRIILPDFVPASTLETLSLQLDNIDVSEMVTVDGTNLSFTPLQALQWGKHVLRLVEYAVDGSIIEKGYWEYEIRHSTSFREFEYRGNINLTATQLVAEQNVGQFKNKSNTAQGSMALASRVAEKYWQINGNIDLIYNSQKDQYENGRLLELGEYLVTANTTRSELKIGYHDISQPSLLIENFRRRGASASINLQTMNSALTGFLMRTEQITGFKNGLGLSDSNNRTNGISLASQPFTDNPELLFLSATYITGKSNQLGETVGGQQSQKFGDAWSLVVDSSLLQQQFRTRFEFASSIVDIVNSEASLNDGKGNAFSLRTSYSPLPDNDNSEIFWSTGLDLSKVDTLFTSLANPNLPNDKQLSRLYFYVDWRGFSTQVSTATESDNVDQDNTRPEIETNRDIFMLSYNLPEVPKKNSLFDIIGTPAINLAWENTTQNEITAATISTQGLNVVSTLSSITTDFSDTNFNWGASYSLAEQLDAIDSSQNSETTSGRLYAQLKIKENIYITPSFESQTTEYLIDNRHSNSFTYQLNSQLTFSDKIRGQVNINQSTTEADTIGYFQNATLSTVSMQFMWDWIIPKSYKPGFSINLSGIYQKREDLITPANELTTYQVFLAVEMKLPIGSTEY